MLISSLLLALIAGGIGYLLVQWRPGWFSGQSLRGFASTSWIAALLLIGALRAVRVVYGPAAMVGMLGLIIGFIAGVWLARRGLKELQ